MLLPASMRIRNIFGTRFSGTLGKELVASSWKGKDYVRAYVVPEDVQAMALDVLRHRVLLTFEAEAEDLDADRVITRILEAVRVP